METITHSFGFNSGGPFVEWCRENEDGTVSVSYWYGSLEACRERAAQPPPGTSDFHAAGDGTDRVYAAQYAHASGCAE